MFDVDPGFHYRNSARFLAGNISIVSQFAPVDNRTTTVKICAYCGRENQDEATQCSECTTTEFKTSTSQPLDAEPKIPPVTWTFATVSEADKEKDLVTLLGCPTLPEADLVVNHLAGAGIETFIPDEFAIQNAAFVGIAPVFVRVQVAPSDYDSAKEFLTALSKD